MKLNSITSAPGSRKPAKRVGRGMGSGKGKTCGRGHKGQKSRSGGKVRAGFEGGQMPLHRRIPKSGFKSRVSRVTDQVSLSAINLMSEDVIDMKTLQNAHVVKHNIKRVKVFASGAISRPVTVRGLALTAGAREAIEAAGGKVE